MDINKLLQCPSCHGPVSPSLSCPNCITKTIFSNGVFLSKSTEGHSYFDERYQTMISGNHEAGTWDLFYKNQIKDFVESIAPGDVILDVGCGPELSYRPPENCTLIGLDPSLSSIVFNSRLSFKIFGSADKVPMANESVDKIICLYSIHHMTSHAIRMNKEILTNAIKEFSRILKVNGELIIFDVSPRFPFNLLQNRFWNYAKKHLRDALDMYFWKDSDLEEVVLRNLTNVTYNKLTYKNSGLITFPPIFSVPKFKLPRFLYPFDINLYKWKRVNFQ